jgi:hypothetical protein
MLRLLNSVSYPAVDANPPSATEFAGEDSASVTSEEEVEGFGEIF